MVYKRRALVTDWPQAKLTREEDGAQKRTRTSTPLLALGPEPSASTNSAIWALQEQLIRARTRIIEYNDL